MNDASTGGRYSSGPGNDARSQIAHACSRTSVAGRGYGKAPVVTPAPPPFRPDNPHIRVGRLGSLDGSQDWLLESRKRGVVFTSACVEAGAIVVPAPVGKDRKSPYL